MIISDLKTIYHLVKPTKGSDQSERLESFYRSQSEHYDQFRAKLLPGRKHLFKKMNQYESSGLWADFGSGTGANLDFLTDEQLSSYSGIHLVDLSASLLEKAAEKINQRNLKNVKLLQEDIKAFNPSERYDVVTFSYSLTMIPQWFIALERAYELLKPGGILAIVDFYVSEKHPMTGLNQHSPWTRNFWPLWFSYDNVFLNADHLPYLLTRFEKIELFEAQFLLPYFPIGQVPYYSFIGRKPQKNKYHHL